MNRKASAVWKGSLKEGCPISKLLTAATITMDAKLA